jgi:hypothetical protein
VGEDTLNPRPRGSCPDLGPMGVCSAGREFQRRCGRTRFRAAKVPGHAHGEAWIEEGDGRLVLSSAGRASLKFDVDFCPSVGCGSSEGRRVGGRAPSPGSLCPTQVSPLVCFDVCPPLGSLDGGAGVVEDGWPMWPDIDMGKGLD